MNNTIQKNIVLGLDVNNVMPHDKNVNHVNEFATSDINANFKQLLDNDIFINQSIIDNANKQIGVKNFSDQISSSVNGSKIWNEDIKSGDAIVYRKQDYDLSDTIEKCLSSNTKFIQNFNNQIYVATDNGFKNTKDFINYENVDEFPPDISVNCINIDQYGSGCIVGTNNGIYQYINLNSERIGRKSDISWKKIDENSDISNINIILRTNRYDLIGTDNGTYIGNLSNDQLIYEGDYGTGAIHDIAIRRVNEKDITQINKNIILACDNGLYHSDISLKINDYGSFPELNNKRVNVTTVFNHKRYFGVYDGLYRLEDNTINKVGSINGDIKFLRVTIDGLIICLGEYIYLLDDEDNITEKFHKENEVFISFLKFKDYDIAATSNKVYVKQNGSDWKELYIHKKIRNIIDIGTIQNMFYIVCSDGIYGGDISYSQIETHKIQLGTQKNSWNVENIIGRYIVTRDGNTVSIYTSDDLNSSKIIIADEPNDIVAITNTTDYIFVATKNRIWQYDLEYSLQRTYDIDPKYGDVINICTFEYDRNNAIITKQGYIGVISNNAIQFTKLGAGTTITSWYTDNDGKELIIFMDNGSAFKVEKNITKYSVLSSYELCNITNIQNVYKVCDIYDSNHIIVGSSLRIITDNKVYNAKIVNNICQELSESNNNYKLVQPESQNLDKLWCYNDNDQKIHVFTHLSGDLNSEITEFDPGCKPIGLLQTYIDDKLIAYDISSIYSSEKIYVYNKILNESNISNIFLNRCEYQEEGEKETSEIIGMSINSSNQFAIADNISSLSFHEKLSSTHKIRSYEKYLIGLNNKKLVYVPFSISATSETEENVYIKFGTASDLSTISNIIDFEVDNSNDSIFFISSDLTDDSSTINILSGSLSGTIINKTPPVDISYQFSEFPLNKQSKFKRLIQLLTVSDVEEYKLYYNGINTLSGVWVKKQSGEFKYYNFITTNTDEILGFELTEKGIITLTKDSDGNKQLKFKYYTDDTSLYTYNIPESINITDIFSDIIEQCDTSEYNIYAHDNDNNIYNIVISDTESYKYYLNPEKYYSAVTDDKKTIVYDSEIIVIRDDGLYKCKKQTNRGELANIHTIGDKDNPIRNVQVYKDNIITLQDKYIKVYNFDKDTYPILSIELPNPQEKKGFFIKRNSNTNNIAYMYYNDNTVYVDGWEFDNINDISVQQNKFQYIISDNTISSVYSNDNVIQISGNYPFILFGKEGFKYIDSYINIPKLTGTSTVFNNISGIISRGYTNNNNYFFKSDGLYVPVQQDDELSLTMYMSNDELGLSENEQISSCFSSNNILFAKPNNNSIIQIYNVDDNKYKDSERTDDIEINGIINGDKILIGNSSGLYEASNIISVNINHEDKYKVSVEPKNSISTCIFLNEKIHTKQYHNDADKKYVQIYDYRYDLVPSKFKVVVRNTIDDEQNINDIFYHRIEKKERSHVIYNNKLLFYDQGNYIEFPEDIQGINNIVYDNDTQHFYILMNTGLYKYQNVENGRIYRPEISYDYAGSIYSIYKITDIEFILCTEKNGLLHYECDDINNIRKYEDTILNKGTTKKIVKCIINGETVYFTSVNNKIYSSNTLRRWKLFLTLPDSVSYINDFYINSYYDMAFATNDGIYRPFSKYQLINDYPKFTKKDAEQLFINNETDIDSYIRYLIEQHEQELHNADSTITQINTLFEPREFNEISGWTKTTKDDDSKIDVISNDIIKNIYSNDTLGDIISLSVSNFYTNNEYTKIDDISYILKIFQSNLFELYIHVPTTMTYYLPHIDDVFGCDISNKAEPLERRNLPRDIMLQDSEISGHFTTLKLKIDESVLSIDNIYDTEINGISLPLKIYKDNENVCGRGGMASSQFHSLILPSTSGMFSKYDYIFYVFGTDEQSIKIFGKVNNIS